MEHNHFKIELNLAGQKIINQLRIHNEQLEKQVSEGITLGLEELVNDDNFKRIVANRTKEQILNMVNEAIISWDVQHKIRDEIQKQIASKIEAHAKTIVNELTKNWKGN